MTLDGVLVGAVLIGIGFAVGVGVSEHYRNRQEQRDVHWSRALEQREVQITALQEHIKDRDASAEDLGY